MSKQEKLKKTETEKLDDALWVYRTVFKTPLGTTPFHIVYGKTCHLPVKLGKSLRWKLKVKLGRSGKKILELSSYRDTSLFSPCISLSFHMHCVKFHPTH